MRGKVLITLLVVALMPSAWAGTGKTIYSFSASDSGDGANPEAGVTLDSKSNLYGTVTDCHFSYGNVFQLTPTDGSWQFEAILPFTGNLDGSCPLANVILDSSGNVYGTTPQSSGGYGVVFQLAPSEVPQRQWTESVYYNFQGWPDGGFPAGGLVMDSAGNLYGTTEGGGDHTASAGVVFQLVPNGIGGWTYNILHTFQGGPTGEVPSDGFQPRSTLFRDEAGNLFGTTYWGGGGGGLCNNPLDGGCGVLFEISPNLDGSWTYRNLHTFTGANSCGTPGKDGAYPWTQLVSDQAGNLYGTTECGGKYGYGTVFEFKQVGKKKKWTEVVLHNFSWNPFVSGKHDGIGPTSGVTFDQAGNLYGTTEEGGAYGDGGVVFKLTHNANGSWKETVLHSFSGIAGDGAIPFNFGGVAVDSSGNVYGTTQIGGSYGLGTVFEISQ